MRHRSIKTEEIYVERRKLVAELLDDAKCVACKLIAALKTYNGRWQVFLSVGKPASEVHEIVNRSQGGSILERRNLLTVCTWCHSWITTHPKDAEMLGLHLPSFKNNDKGFADAERRRREWAKGNPLLLEQ